MVIGDEEVIADEVRQLGHGIEKHQMRRSLKFLLGDGDAAALKMPLHDLNPELGQTQTMTEHQLDDLMVRQEAKLLQLGVRRLPQIRNDPARGSSSVVRLFPYGALPYGNDICQDYQQCNHKAGNALDIRSVPSFLLSEIFVCDSSARDNHNGICPALGDHNAGIREDRLLGYISFLCSKGRDQYGQFLSCVYARLFSSSPDAKRLSWPSSLHSFSCLSSRHDAWR